MVGGIVFHKHIFFPFFLFFCKACVLVELIMFDFHLTKN